MVIGIRKKRDKEEQGNEEGQVTAISIWSEIRKAKLLCLRLCLGMVVHNAHEQERSQFKPCSPEMQYLLPQLAERDFLVVVLVQHLRRGQIEVLLSHVHTPFSQRIHTSLCADTLQFGP